MLQPTISYGSACKSVTGDSNESPREGKASCGDIRDSFGLDDYIEPLTTVSPSATSHTKIAQGIVRPSKTAISAASAATFSDASSQVDALGGPLDPVVQKPATTESATPAFIDVTEAETSTTTAATSTATSTWYPNGGAPFTVEDYYPPHNVVFAESELHLNSTNSSHFQERLVPYCGAAGWFQSRDSRSLPH